MVSAVTAPPVVRHFNSGYNSVMRAWSASTRPGVLFFGARNTQPGSRSRCLCATYDQAAPARRTIARFTSDTWVRYQQLQVRILRDLCPHHLITHNLMGLFPYVDYVALAQDLDVVSWDNYPRLPTPWSPFNGGWNACHVAMAHDLVRSLKGRTFWVMEQQAGPSGWGRLSPTPL